MEDEQRFRPESGFYSICSLLIILGSGMWAGRISVASCFCILSWVDFKPGQPWVVEVQQLRVTVVGGTQKCVLRWVGLKSPCTPEVPAIRTHSPTLPLSLRATLISTHTAFPLPQLSSHQGR